MTTSHASKSHTRTQSSEYVQVGKETLETIVASIRAAATTKDDTILEKLLYRFDDYKIDRDENNSFKKRQIQSTLLNEIEDALDGDKQAYRRITRTCDQL